MSDRIDAIAVNPAPMTVEEATALRDAKHECYLAAIGVECMFRAMLDIGQLRDLPPNLELKLRELKAAFDRLDRVRERYAMDGARAQCDAATGEGPR